MDIGKQIKALQKVVDELKSIEVTASNNKNSSWTLKWGKKLNMIRIPSKEWAMRIKAAIDVAIDRQLEDAERVLDLLEERCEELVLPLFESGVENGD